MKLAFQTICWNHRVKKAHWPQLFKSIKAAGFDGVEVFQHPDDLPAWPTFRDHAEASGLKILGLTGGTVAQRVNYLRPVGIRPSGEEPYLYIERWDDEAESAYESDFVLALHYHHLSALPSVSDALELLTSKPKLKWLPDTAHLFIGQQNNDRLQELLLRHLDRTIAVHLKDWKASYGRFSHRYARGFCVIGQGQIKIKELVKRLNKSGYQGWYVVELDYAASNPDDDMQASAHTLQEWKFLSRKPTTEPSDIPTDIDTERVSFTADKLLHLASRGETSFYSDVAKLLREQFKADGAAICLTSNAAAGTSVQALLPAPDLAGDPHLQRHTEDLARRCVKHKTPQSERYGQLERLAIPVENRYSPNQIRLVLVFDVRQGNTGFDRTTAESKLFQLMFGDVQDVFVTERCLAASAEASRLASQYSNQGSYLNAIANLVKRKLDCEGVTIFVSTPSHEALVVGGTTGIHWAPEYQWPTRQRYDYGTGRTGRSAQTRSYSIFRDSDELRKEQKVGKARSHETGVNVDVDGCLIAPFFDSRDEVAGVVRCRNKKDGQDVMYFSEEDLALVEAIMQVVQPTLEVLAEDRLVTDAVTLLAHELGNPIFAMRGALADLEFEVTNQRYIRPDSFPDLQSWLDLMVRQLKQYELFVGSKMTAWEPKRSVVKFIGDIVAPTVAQARMLLQERGFSPTRINYGKLSDWLNIPFLYVDRNMFEQVVFNLISNAIKYADSDPTLFHLTIRGERHGERVHLIFEDNGIGVPPSWEQDIFLQHSRVIAEDRAATSGHGLGLWVVDRIVKLHRSRVFLDSLSSPTRFVIDLPPTALAKRTGNTGY